MGPVKSSKAAQQLRDWEEPGRLLRRYLEAAGTQALGVAMCAAGFIVVAIGWWKISKEAIVALQIPYLVSGGIGGALLLGMGGVLLLAHNLRLDNRRLEAIEESLDELRDALLLEAGAEAPGRLLEAGAEPLPARAVRNGSRGPATGPFVRVPGGTRFHLPDCPIAARKAVDRLDESDVAGLEPCKLCSPVATS